MKRLNRLLGRLVPPRAETSAVGVTIVLAGLVGIGAALAALLLDRAIPVLNEKVFLGIGRLPTELAEPWRYLLILIPPAVFVAVAYLLRRWAPEAAGAGIGQVMSAVGRGGGYIRDRVAALKVVATALCIGAGAPLGVEGPVVQTGAAVGSAIGRRARMGVRNLRVLVAAGAAGALAAKYGAPIGGAVFSAELILGSASTAALLPLIIASFLAVVTRFVVMQGRVAEYTIVAAQLRIGPVDYFMFAALGIVCGLVATYFIKLIFATEDLMRRLFSQWWAMATFGGLVIGLAGFLRPELLGTGHHVIQNLLQRPEYSVQLLILFILLKPLLCSVALGSGTSGGIFAPALFTGAALGALVVSTGSGALGLDLGSNTAYAMVGMAALMGAVMRAPLQAILITFELARNYSAVPPLMIACVVAYKVSEMFEPESAFTRWLVRRGERLGQGMDFALLDRMQVRDVMREDYVALAPEAPLSEVASRVQQSQNRTCPVADEEGRLVGIVMLARLMSAGAEVRPGEPQPQVRELLEPEEVFLSPGSSLADAWTVMGNYDYDCLPVCEPVEDGLRIVGICEGEAIIELHDRQAFVSLVGDQPDERD